MLLNSSASSLRVDIHSHLIPGIDDGVKSVEASVEILSFLAALGYKKVITTPHIKAERYPNTPTIINQGLVKVREEIERQHVDIQVEAAAEYYLDETFLEQIMSKEKMMTLGENYLLVETSFYSKPVNMDEIIFEVKSAGYIPILAHPERYHYLEGDVSWLAHLKTMDVLFQVTLTSLAGYYGDTPRKVAKELIRQGMVDFLGTDIHRPSQLELNEKALKDKHILKAIKQGVLNQQLFSE